MFRLAKQQLCTCIMHFCTFFCRRCTTTMWNCLIARLVEDVNTRQRLSFSLTELWYSPLELNSRKIRQHLTNWRHCTRWNICDKVWISANSLFKKQFRSRHRRCCLSSLLTAIRQYQYSSVYLQQCSPAFCYFSVWEVQKAEQRPHYLTGNFADNILNSQYMCCPFAL